MSAVFLDRDGTIIEEVGYLDRRDRVELYPYATDAIKALNRAGIPIVLVTNQSGIARGFFDAAIVEDVHAHIADLLARGGAHIDRYYFCPHHPEGHIPEFAVRCDCRKPGRALVDRAARELGIDPATSFTVGDRWVDVGLARSIGGKGVLVRTGYGVLSEARTPPGMQADAVVNNLVEAASWILANR